MLYATCDITAYPSIYLRIQDFWFEIKPETYVLPKPRGIVGDFCPIAIASSNSNDVILGRPFMENYYMIFDIDSDEIGIAHHSLMQSKFY